VSDLDLRGVSEAIGRRELSSLEATEAYLERIDRYDGALQSYITVMADQARQAARAADAELTGGNGRGPLHGVPIALKDLIAVAGVRMTAGSRVLADNVPASDAFLTTRLKQAGAVILGKTALHEFAFGRPDLEGPFLTGRNPWDLEREPAGSSSGTAAAVAAGLCAGGLGSDTGGSIRGPSSNCGLVGVKPSYGLVSRAGVAPMCWSLDHVGPMTRSVWDSAVLLQAIAGHDPADASTSTAEPPDYTRTLGDGVRGLRLGLLRRYYHDWPDLDPDVRSAAEAAYGVLEGLGAKIVDVDAPTLDLAPAVWAPFLAEMYEYHADSVRRAPELYRETTRPRLYMGALFTAQDLLHAQRLRARLAREVADILREVDAIVFPGQASPALRFTDVNVTELIRPGMRYTAPWNLTGSPAVVVPSGFSRDGLPVSIQLVGRPFDEATLFRIAHSYEQATEWHTRRPDPSGWR
jgi:aspartyl-tRNA(Asn)/glutamyl-tRNA(Gln) amidotransferase subunit A